jgi:hypothetical protein
MIKEGGNERRRSTNLEDDLEKDVRKGGNPVQTGTG